MTTKTELLQTVRAKCIDCSGGSLVEVRECVIPACPLYPFRMGTDPTPARGGRKVGAAKANDDGQPTEQEEWRDFDPDC